MDQQNDANIQTDKHTDKHTDRQTFRAVYLVTTDAHQVDVHFINTDWNFADSLMTRLQLVRPLQL